MNMIFIYITSDEDDCEPKLKYERLSPDLKHILQKVKRDIYIPS